MPNTFDEAVNTSSILNHVVIAKLSPRVSSFKIEKEICLVIGLPNMYIICLLGCVNTTAKMNY